MTANGHLDITVPRDRNGEFEPRIVPKHARRLGNIQDMILSLYSRGMTTRDIQAHLAEIYGVSASPDLISKVTDVVHDEIKAWQSRPVDAVYPIVYVDGIRLNIRDNGVVTQRSAHLVIGIDTDGRKHALGVWIESNEGANQRSGTNHPLPGVHLRHEYHQVGLGLGTPGASADVGGASGNEDDGLGWSANVNAFAAGGGYGSDGWEYEAGVGSGYGAAGVNYTW